MWDWITLMILNTQVKCKMFQYIEECNPDKKRKVLIVFDDMIADMISNTKINLVVTELFIRRRKLNISFLFITLLYFKVPKDVGLNALLDYESSK